MGFLGSMFGGFGGRRGDDGGSNTGQENPLASSAMGAMNKFQSMGGFGGLKQPGGMAGGQQGIPQVGMGGGMSGGMSRGFGNMAAGFGALGNAMGQKPQFGQGPMAGTGGLAMSNQPSPMSTAAPPVADPGMGQGPMGQSTNAVPIGGMNSMNRFAQHMGQFGGQVGQGLGDKFGAGNAYKAPPSFSPGGGNFQPPPGFSGNPQTAPINRMPDFFRNNTGFNPGASQEPVVKAPEGEGFEKYPGLANRSPQELEDFFKQMTDPGRARPHVQPRFGQGGIF